MAKETKKTTKEVVTELIKEGTPKDVVVAVFPGDERVEYSKKVHGKDFKQIAEDTCERLGGKIE